MNWLVVVAMATHIVLVVMTTIHNGRKTGFQSYLYDENNNGVFEDKSYNLKDDSTKEHHSNENFPSTGLIENDRLADDEQSWNTEDRLADEKVDADATETQSPTENHILLENNRNNDWVMENGIMVHDRPNESNPDYDQEYKPKSYPKSNAALNYETNGARIYLVKRGGNSGRNKVCRKTAKTIKVCKDMMYNGKMVRFCTKKKVIMCTSADRLRNRYIIFL